MHDRSILSPEDDELFEESEDISIDFDVGRESRCTWLEGCVVIVLAILSICNSSVDSTKNDTLHCYKSVGFFSPVPPFRWTSRQEVEPRQDVKAKYASRIKNLSYNWDQIHKWKRESWKWQYKTITGNFFVHFEHVIDQSFHSIIDRIPCIKLTTINWGCSLKSSCKCVSPSFGCHIFFIKSKVFNYKVVLSFVIKYYSFFKNH